MDEIWTFVPYKHLPLESDSHFPNQPFLAILLHEFLAPENRLLVFFGSDRGQSGTSSQRGKNP